MCCITYDDQATQDELTGTYPFKSYATPRNAPRNARLCSMCTDEAAVDRCSSIKTIITNLQAKRIFILFVGSGGHHVHGIRTYDESKEGVLSPTASKRSCRYQTSDKSHQVFFVRHERHQQFSLGVLSHFFLLLYDILLSVFSCKNLCAKCGENNAGGRPRRQLSLHTERTCVILRGTSQFPPPRQHAKQISHRIMTKLGNE